MGLLFSITDVLPFVPLQLLKCLAPQFAAPRVPLPKLFPVFPLTHSGQHSSHETRPVSKPKPIIESHFPSALSVVPATNPLRQLQSPQRPSPRTSRASPTAQSTFH